VIFMTLSRRTFLRGTAAGATAVAAGPFLNPSARAADAVKVGVILDQSGGLDIYGQPMVDTIALAAQEVNDAGGLNGRPVELVVYDAQSNTQFYTQYATEAATREQVSVVHGGITSASREAIRPILDRYRTLYMYSTQYEGGVCDRNVFCTGSTPAQTVEKLVPHAMNKWGKKVYILAADYNYGQITADWVGKYTRDNGGEVVGAEFFPLDVTEFGPTIRKIQAAKPDLVVSVLVGGAHVSFYRQWAAAGMKSEIPMASTTFGVGNEHRLMSPEEGDGMLVAYGYFEEIDTQTNRDFLSRYLTMHGAEAAYVNELAARSYESFHLWAEAVRRAGTDERMAVIEALESEIPFEGPSGAISIDRKTHHIVQNVYLAELENQAFKILETHPMQRPTDTDLVCDLVANPDDATFYFENGLEAAGVR
jgi:branched-chain amino acid transport system substrate-binding protein